MKQLFRRVLCPVDFGPNTAMTIEMARRIVEETGGTLILFHVVPMAIEALGQPILGEHLHGAEHDAKERLRKLADEMLKVPCEIAVLTGQPAGAILDAAVEQHADLIV